jgi:hypothetical protein
MAGSQIYVAGTESSNASVVSEKGERWGSILISSHILKLYFSLYYMEFF